MIVETPDLTTTLSGGTETWAHVTGSPVSVTGLVRLNVFWARASQDAPTSPATNDAGDHQMARIAAFRGIVPTGNPWHVVQAGTHAVTDTALSAPAVTTTVPDCLIVSMAAMDLPDANSSTNAGAPANGSLSNVAEQMDTATAQGNGGAIWMATGGLSTPGASGNTTSTLAVAAQKAMMTLALAPATSLPDRPALRRRRHLNNR
jgi:hypothetical protein